MSESTEVQPRRETVLRLAPASGNTDVEAIGRALRRFVRAHASDKRLEKIGAGWVPAHLHRYREELRVRTSFPFYLPDPAGEGTGGESVDTLLRRVAQGLEADPGDLRILTDNLERFERAIRLEVERRARPTPLAEIESDVLDAAGSGLSERVREALGRAWPLLVSTIPSGTLLPFDRDVPLHLWTHAARVRARDSRARLRAELLDLRRRAREQLALESPEADGLARSFGAALEILDPGEIARVSRTRAGRVGLEPARRQALTEAADVIEAYLDGAEPPTILIVQEGEPAPEHRQGGREDGNGRGSRRPEVREGGSVLLVRDIDPTTRALELFLREADAWTELFQAIRRCRLEVEGNFESSRHEPYLSGMTRETLTADEASLLPPVVAVERAARLRGGGLGALSHVLRSGWPVHVLVTLDPFEDTAPDRFRLELGYVAIGHRRAAVHQGVASEPNDLLAAFQRLAGRLEPSLHLIAVSEPTAEPGPWLHLGAAVEGRAHPIFLYDPETGRSWADRLDFRGNPATERDWPVYPLVYRDAKDEEVAFDAAFTFVDFALLDPAARDHFRVVPEGFEHPDLVPAAEALRSGDGEAPCVPYIWGVDAGGRLARLAVTESMLRAARDRQDFWRTLQELAGVRNAYVETAVAEVEERLESRAQREREEREEAFRRELERARDEAGRDALAGVAQFLLGLGDASGGWLEAAALGGALAVPPRPAGERAESAPAARAAEGGAPAEGATAPAAPPTARAEGSGPVAAAVAETEDPWVDTVLCTSCNDCIQINPRLFVYDANKQVRLGDPEAGTYAELVRAAEKCPAKCIHPGTPLDPDEPGLAELMQRARAFR